MKPAHNYETSVDAIAERLWLLRTAQDLIAAQLCKKLGFEPNTYSQWENAKGRPRLDEMILYCEHTGVTLDWIYRGQLAGMTPDMLGKIATARTKLNTRKISDKSAPVARRRMAS